MLKLLTRREHSATRQRNQFRTVDAVSLLVVLSMSLAIVTTALRNPVIAAPVDLVSQVIAQNVWMLPFLAAFFWFIATRELESLAVHDSMKRVLFVCFILPCVTVFAVAISISILMIFQIIELPASYPSPIPLAILAVPAGFGLRLLGNWCLLPPAFAIVEHVD